MVVSGATRLHLTRNVQMGLLSRLFASRKTTREHKPSVARTKHDVQTPERLEGPAGTRPATYPIVERTPPDRPDARTLADFDWLVDPVNRLNALAQAPDAATHAAMFRTLFEQHIAEAPDATISYLHLARCMSWMNQRDEAVALLIRGLQAANKPSRLLMHLADMAIDDREGLRMCQYVKLAVVAQAHHPSSAEPFRYYAAIADAFSSGAIAEEARQIAQQIDDETDLLDPRRALITALAARNRAGVWCTLPEFAPIQAR